MTISGHAQAMRGILSRINSPQDIKELSEKQLLILAEEIRQELIGVLSQTGLGILAQISV
jgi:deoxyxylulose-5-phosphate synthase